MGIRGVWVAAKELLIVPIFVAVPLIFCHVRKFIDAPPLDRISTKQTHTTSPVMWRTGALCLNGRRRTTVGRRGGGGHTPVLAKFPLFSTKVKIRAYLPPSLEFLQNKRTGHYQ
jgi:hypothetical protein